MSALLGPTLASAAQDLLRRATNVSHQREDSIGADALRSLGVRERLSLLHDDRARVRELEAFRDEIENGGVEPDRLEEINEKLGILHGEIQLRESGKAAGHRYNAWMVHAEVRGGGYVRDTDLMFVSDKAALRARLGPVSDERKSALIAELQRLSDEQITELVAPLAEAANELLHAVDKQKDESDSLLYRMITSGGLMELCRQLVLPSMAAVGNELVRLPFDSEMSPVLFIAGLICIGAPHIPDIAALVRDTDPGSNVIKKHELLNAGRLLSNIALQLALPGARIASSVLTMIRFAIDHHKGLWKGVAEQVDGLLFFLGISHTYWTKFAELVKEEAENRVDRAGGIVGRRILEL